MLVLPILGQPLILYIFATAVALGTLLVQLDDKGNEKAMYYLNWTLVGYDLNYISIERACLAVVFCLHKLCHYMLNHTTHPIAKIDLLKYFLSKCSLTSHAKKWILILSEFKFFYKYRKPIKGQVIANQLIEAPLQGAHPIIEDFLDEIIMTITHNGNSILMVLSHRRIRGKYFVCYTARRP